MADKIKFLYGTIADISQSNSGNSSYPQVTRGQVYFAIDSLTSSAVNGQIYFDVPIGTGTQAKRILMNDSVRFASTASFASTAGYASSANRAVNDGAGNSILATYLSKISISGHTLIAETKGGNTSTCTLPDNDYRLKVTSANTTSATKAFLVGFTSSTLGTANNSITSTGVVFPNIYIGANGVINGTITNASTAAIADKALKDNSNHNIVDYIYNVTSTSINSIPNLVFTRGSGTEPTTWKFPYTPLNSNGKIDIKYIPNTAIERFIKAYASTAAMLNDLGGTNPSVAAEPGDLVKAGNSMYVITSTALGNINSYEEFAVGTAGAVAWNNVTGKPALLSTASKATLSTSTTNATIKISWMDYSGTESPASHQPNLVIPAAATNVAGLVTTGAQTFAGAKTFNTTATFSNRLNYSGIQVGSGAKNYLWFASSSTVGVPTYSTNLFYDVTNNTLNVPRIQKIEVSNSADSTYSLDANASIVTNGGISVSKQLSAEKIRIDNNSQTKSVTLNFDLTKEVLSFVFQ